jgi:hypothetical protein
MKKTSSFALPAAFSLAAIALSTASCGSTPGDATTSAQANTQQHSDPTPKRPETKEACDACGGLWAVHGFLPEESCICATRDAGRSCTDGKQCEGACIVDGNEQFQVVEGGSSARGFYVGRCAAFDTTFGCYRIIPDGAAEQGPHTADEGVAEICVD